MSLIDNLLSQARMLAKVDEHGRTLSSKGRPRQADLRRAISTAYYAVFHAITERAVQEVLGAADVKSPWGHRLRRTVSHAGVANVAKWFEAGSGSIPPTLQPLRGELATPIDQTFSDFCTAVRELQEERHKADYDMSLLFTAKDTRHLIRAASDAVNVIRESTVSADVRLFLLACVFGNLQKNA